MTLRAYHECDGPRCAVAVETTMPNLSLRANDPPPPGWLVMVCADGTDWPVFCSPVCAAQYDRDGEKS